MNNEQPSGFWGHIDLVAASASTVLVKGCVISAKSMQPIEDSIDHLTIITSGSLRKARHQEKLEMLIEAEELAAAQA